MKRGVRSASLFAFALVVALIASSALCQPSGLVRVEVLADGTAHVVYTFPTNGSASVDLGLVGLPDPGLLILVHNEKGDTLPYAVNETAGMMTIVTLDSSQVTVDYYTSTIVSKISGRWIVNFTTPLPVRVKLPPNATLSALYVVPISITAEGQSVVLTYLPGPVVVAYVLPPAVKPPTPSPQTPSGAQTTPPATSASEGKPSTQGQAEGAQQAPSVLLYAAAAIVVLAVLAALLVLRRRGSEEGLSEVDVQILNLLKQSGGGLFQSELTSLVGLPTTTVWRHVRKLESMGLVAVEKRMGRNFVRLIRRP